MSESLTIKELSDSHPGAHDSNEAPSNLNHTVDGNKSSQQHLNPTELHISSPEIVLSQSPRAEAFDEVVEAAKARDISRLKVIINSLSYKNYSMNPESLLNSVQPITNSPKDSVSSTQIAVTGPAQNSNEASQIPSTDSLSIPSSPPSVISQQASSSISPPANEASKLCEEQKMEETGVLKELTGPPSHITQPTPVVSAISSTPSVVLPVTAPTFNSAVSLPIKPFDISTCLEVSAKVAVCSTSGDLAPIPLKHPDYPSILLHLKTVPPATYGQMINLSFSTQWILSRLCQLLEANPSANGSPIVLPLSISLNSATPAVEMQPPPQQSQQIPSLSLQNNPPKGITLPLQPQSQTPVTSIIQQQQQPPTVKPISGARKMRAIAPKPATSNSLSGGLSMNSVSMRSSTSRPARKIISGPMVAPSTLSLQSSSAAIAPAATTLVNPGTLVNNTGVNSNSRSAFSMLRKAANSPNSRNRNRRKNPATSFPIVAVSTLPQVQSSVPVANTTTTTTIVPPSAGYIVDPTTGALISADATTVSGGFIQPIMHPSPNGTQFFAPPGSILVGASNGGIIPMPIGGVIPAEPKSSDAETGELLANPQNSYQSTFLVPADGSNEGFSQQVFFTNGGPPNGHFILPSYQTTTVPSGEYVQPLQTQSTDYIQTNGNEFYFTDGSCYMPYSTLIGQAQPVATVEIKEDGSTVDIQPDGEDILDVAMRVAREGSGPNMTETVTLAPTIELADEANSALNEFMQSSAVDSSAEYGDHQQMEHVNIEESVLGADQQTSTGDAKIDALLAEAALVSSVNGVGDDQSAVSVPVTSLLGSRAGAATTTVAASNNNDACTIVEAATNCTDMNEFPQALYDSLVNFDSSIVQDTLPASSTAAATEAAFTYVTQQVRGLEADFGATTVDLDVTSSHVADSFLKDLATQVDEMSAELAAKEEAQKSSGDQNEPEIVSVEADDAVTSVPHFGEREDGTSQPDDMEDILRAVDGVPCDDDDDSVSFFLTRGYDVDDFGLLDPTNETPVSPPQVPDDINEQNETNAVSIVHDNVSASSEVHISHNNPVLTSSGLLHPAENTTLNESLLPPELSLNDATVFNSSPGAERSQSPNIVIQETNPVNHDVQDESDDDDSGSELDFLPSREKSMESHLVSEPQMSSVPVEAPRESLPCIEPYHSLRPLNTVSPQPFQKSPRTPKQSTPRVRTARINSALDALSPPRRRSNRRYSREATNSGNSSTPVSPRRHLRSSTTAARKNTEVDSVIILSDDEEAPHHPSNIKNESGNISPNNANKLETTLDTEPFLEESTLLCTQESSQLQSPKGRNSKAPSILSSSLIETGDQTSVSLSASAVWNVNADRPRSFGLISTEVSALVPVNNISEAQLELRDNPVLQSDMPFWSDPNAYSTSDDTSTESGCQGERRPDSVGISDDSDADSMLSLQAAVRAASFALNVQFSSPLTLPRDDKTFSRFAAAPSLQSFETLAPANNPLQSTGVNNGDSSAPPISSPSTGSADNDEDSSEGTITPNSCIPDPANLSFSETLFPPKFPSPTISSKPPSVPILQGCNVISTSFSAIAKAAVNPPKMTDEILTAAPQEEVTVDESLCDTEHLPLQCEIVPSTSLVSPVAKMVASTSDDVAQSIGDDSVPVEIIDLPTCAPSNENASPVEIASSVFKQPLKMKIILSNILKRDKEKSKKKKSKKAALKRKSEENLQNSSSAPSPPKLKRLTSKFLISRVGNSFFGKTIESESTQIADQPTPSVPLPIPLLKPFQPPIWAAVKPARRGRPPSSVRGRSRCGVSRGAKLHTAPPRPTPSTVVEDRDSCELPMDQLQSLEPPAACVCTSGAGRKFFSSSKEDRRSSAITKNRSWRHSFGGMARKRGRFSASLNTGDCRSSQSNHQPVSFQAPLSLSALPGADITSPTEPLRVRIRVAKDESSGQPSGNSQAGSELQATEGENTIVTSNPGEEEIEDEKDGTEADSGPEVPAQPVFFVAPEAETFVDKNQARIRLVVNRPACVANGIDPGNADDNTEDDEEEEDDEGNGGNASFFPPSERLHRHLPPSDKPPGSHGTSEPQQSYHSHQSASQPHNYTSQTPAFNHQPAVFSPLRCDMTGPSTGAQQHQPTNRASADALGSARSSSTASGSLPAPSTISPAPFTLAPTNNDSENNDQNFYQRHQQSRQFTETRVERQSPPPSAYNTNTSNNNPHQQQHSHQAIAAAYAAMVANTFLTQQVLMPPYNAYGQQHQDQSRGHLEYHSNSLHHQQQEQRHQRTAVPSYRGESSSNEAHQQQHSYSLTSNFSNLVPDGDPLNYYPWNAQQYQHQMHRQNSIRSNERYYCSSSPSHHTLSANLPVGVPTASQWYQGTAHSSANPGQSSTSQAPNPASSYPQLDDSAVVAAVAAAGYRLSPFSRLS